MTRLIRLALWFYRRLPLYSANSCAQAWFDGRDFERGQLGIVRGENGRFVGAKNGGRVE